MEEIRIDPYKQLPPEVFDNLLRFVLADEKGIRGGAVQKVSRGWQKSTATYLSTIGLQLEKSQRFLMLRHIFIFRSVNWKMLSALPLEAHEEINHIIFKRLLLKKGMSNVLLLRNDSSPFVLTIVETKWGTPGLEFASKTESSWRVSDLPREFRKIFKVSFALPPSELGVQFPMAIQNFYIELVKEYDSSDLEAISKGMSRIYNSRTDRISVVETPYETYDTVLTVGSFEIDTIVHPIDFWSEDVGLDYAELDAIRETSLVICVDARVFVSKTGVARSGDEEDFGAEKYFGEEKRIEPGGEWLYSSKIDDTGVLLALGSKIFPKIEEDKPPARYSRDESGSLFIVIHDVPQIGTKIESLWLPLESMIIYELESAVEVREAIPYDVVFFSHDVPDSVLRDLFMVQKKEPPGKARGTGTVYEF